MSQKRYAYLIGANGPEGMRLKHAERDVTRLADALKGPYCQFAHTEVVIAQSRKDGLKGFKDFAEQRDPTDLLLVHFSGHAYFDEELYLLCNDTDIQDLYSTALEVRTIKTIMGKSPARHKVLILDCCHAAGAHGNALKGEQDIRGMLHQTMQGSATVILSACSRRERTREVDELDGGSGFLSWAVRAGCTTNFHEASSAPDLNVLSLDDLWRRWIPKALEYVNSLLGVGKPLPPPILLSELESGYSSEIWLTDPPSLVRDIRTSSDETRRKYLEQVYKRYSSVTLPIGPTEGFSLQAIFQPLALRRDPLAAEDLERRQRRTLLGEQHGEDDDSPSTWQRKELSDGTKQPARVRAENGEEALSKSPQGRVVILGGPGTGKTTTLKHLVSWRAKDALSNRTGPIPIFLSLADLASSGKTLQSYLIDVVEDMGVERSYADTLWKAIEN